MYPAYITPMLAPGPHRAQDLPPKTPLELSYGHFIECMTTGARGGKSNLCGAQVLATDPKVKAAGIDVGFELANHTVRAPDVAVGDIPDKKGWAPGAPLLAVEYADTGQNERTLADKIRDLLSYGTQYIWVVRLTGPRRVEVHEPGRAMYVVAGDGTLYAPKALTNPVAVAALYDTDAANAATLRNLLQRAGYGSVEQIHARGKVEGKAEGEVKGKVEGKIEGQIAEAKAMLKRLLTLRFGTLPKWVGPKIDTASLEQVESWMEGILTAQDIQKLLGR